MQLGQGMMDEAQTLSAAYQRPEMQTPQAIQMMTEMARGGQFENMPGMTTMTNQINKATASGVNAMKEMGTGAEAFGGVANLYAQNMDAQSNLGVDNAQFKEGRRDQYMGALEGLGDWQHQACGWNEADPYLNAQNKAAQLDTMGRQGQWEGLKNKMGSWAEAFGGIAGTLGDAGGELGSLIGQGKGSEASYS